MHRRRIAIVGAHLAALSTLPTAGCANLSGLEGGGGSAEGGAGKVPCPAATYNLMGSSSQWGAFDVATVNPMATGYSGGAFDGEHLYLVPDYHNSANGGVDHGIVARFDASVSFTSAASWSTFDLSTVDAKAVGFSVGAFDGKYVYLVPGSQYQVSVNSVLARYDIATSFTLRSSWSTIDVSTVNPNAAGFGGAAFDGRYLYLVPYAKSVAARYDTTSPLTSSEAWAAFDVSTAEPNIQGFSGAAFDGRFVYFVPAGTNNTRSGLVVRCDTTLPFTSSGAWGAFDATKINTDASGFNGAAFDGRYVYFIPNSGVVAVRYDTKATFGSNGSWSAFDTSMLASPGGFSGATFDGRYVYLVPSFRSGEFDSIVLRYDTTLSFTNGGSWTKFDVGAVNSMGAGFSGGVFDGRAVYLVPDAFNFGMNDGIVARFDAKSPSCLPTGWSASFF